MSRNYRHFFHTLPHHSEPNSAKGPLAHVKGIIVAVLPEDDNIDGGKHQHLQMRVETTLELIGGNGDINGQTLFLAIRFGDSSGLPNPIPDLQEDNPIEAQGEYIDAMRAEPTPDNQDPILPVLHFTHHPHGFIIYENKKFD